MRPNQTGAVVAKIENIFESLTDCMLDDKKELVIQLKTRRHVIANQNDNGEEIVGQDTNRNIRTLKFPSKNPREAWKFTALLRVLELSHDALVNGVVTTKRDIYYRDPDLFIKQIVVDRFVDDIAYTFGVNRDALNVVATAKGVTVGSFKIMKQDGSIVDFGVEPNGLFVPNARDIFSIAIGEVRWLIVIEKEATFRTLATSNYWKDSACGRGILITAKGYPDIQTRQFLHLFSSLHPSIPILAFMDFDPDGIGIMSTYKHGSLSLAHETDVAVPSMKWLGVRSKDVIGSFGKPPGLLSLSARDRRVALRMLNRSSIGVEGSDQEWRRECQVMLMLNLKAEIQIVGNGEELSKWLDDKLPLYS